MKKLTVTLFVFIQMNTTLSFAQKDTADKRLRLQALPSVFHTPETSWGFGATLLAFYTPKDSITRLSNAQIFLDGTLMKQASFQSDLNLYTRHNKNYIKASHDLSKFPESYFGIGNDTKIEHQCLINIAYFDVKIAALQSVKHSGFVGAILHHQTLSSLNKTITHEGLTIDEMGYSATGIGADFMIDKRNFILNPSEGYFVETKLSKYTDHTHKTGGFWNSSVDARYYKTFRKLVFNSNVYAVHNQGLVPFRMMPYIGGPRFLRGYYAGRFRDNNLALAQVEFRRNLFWRIGIAAFTGAGQVYSDISQFGLSRFHYNYGGGLRLQLSKHSPANIRLDYVQTADSQGFYIVFG